MRFGLVVQGGVDGDGAGFVVDAEALGVVAALDGVNEPVGIAVGALGHDANDGRERLHVLLDARLVKLPREHRHRLVDHADDHGGLGAEGRRAAVVGRHRQPVLLPVAFQGLPEGDPAGLATHPEELAVPLHQLVVDVAVGALVGVNGSHLDDGGVPLGLLGHDGVVRLVGEHGGVVVDVEDVDLDDCPRDTRSGPAAVVPALDLDDELVAALHLSVEPLASGSDGT